MSASITTVAPVTRAVTAGVTPSFGAGDRVRIVGLARHDGKVAVVEQVFDDGHVQVKLDEGGRLSLSKAHLAAASGAASAGAGGAVVLRAAAPTVLGGDGQPLKAKIRELPRAIGLSRGERVRLTGQAPAQFIGKVGYVDTADIGDGTGRVRVRLEAEFSQHSGYITTGGTFAIETLTVEEAKAKCAMMGGKGFTFQGSAFQGVVKAYFKNKWDLQGPGSGWTSFRVEDTGGPKWMLASPIHLERC